MWRDLLTFATNLGYSGAPTPSAAGLLSYAHNRTGGSLPCCPFLHGKVSRIPPPGCWIRYPTDPPRGLSKIFFSTKPVPALSSPLTQAYVGLLMLSREAIGFPCPPSVGSSTNTHPGGHAPKYFPRERASTYVLFNRGTDSTVIRRLGFGPRLLEHRTRQVLLEEIGLA